MKSAHKRLRLLAENLFIVIQYMYSVHYTVLGPYRVGKNRGIKETAGSVITASKNRRFRFLAVIDFCLFSARIPKFLAIFLSKCRYFWLFFAKNLGFFVYFTPKFQIYWPFFTRFPNFWLFPAKISKILGYFEITEIGGFFGRFRFGYFWRLTAVWRLFG